MPTKDELADKIGDLTGQEIVPENHSKAELEAMHEKAVARVTIKEDPVLRDAEGNPVEGSTEVALDSLPDARLGVASTSPISGEAGESPLSELQPTRRKINRGSTRRINRAVENIENALDEFARELDGQVYLADAEGNREAEHPLVTDVKNMKDFIRDAVQQFT